MAAQGTVKSPTVAEKLIVQRDPSGQNCELIFPNLRSRDIKLEGTNMSSRGKVPPGLVWLGILIVVAILMSVILGFRIDKRLWGELRIDRIALSNLPTTIKAFAL